MPHIHQIPKEVNSQVCSQQRQTIFGVERLLKVPSQILVSKYSSICLFLSALPCVSSVWFQMKITSSGIDKLIFLKLSVEVVIGRLKYNRN